MTVAYLFDPVKQFVSRNGIPLAGGFLNVFVGESQEPADTFSDAAGNVLNPKKIPIDSAGRALGVFVDDSKLYTLKAYNAGGQLQFSIYPVSPRTGGGGGSGDSYYYPGDEYIYIDQDAREISLHNTKAIRGDEETITMEDTQDAIILHVNPDIIGDEVHVAAGEHTSVDYDSDSNTFTVNAEYAGSDTVEIDSDGSIHGKYSGGYGIGIDGNTVKNINHKMVSTNSTKYNYCKVFEFTWNRTYGRGLCVFSATNPNGDYVTFVLQLTRVINADYTVVRPFVVSASPSMVSGSFVERLEVRTSGDKLIGYLKLKDFSQSQFWLDWEGISDAGKVSFDPQLTNTTEGDISWTCSVTKSNVSYPQTDADDKFQVKLIPGDGINLDSDGNISAIVNEYTNGVAVAIYNGSPQMSETEFAKIQQAVINKKIVYVLFGNAGSLYYYGLVKFGSAGYGFMYESNTLKEYMLIDNNGNVTRTTLPSGGPSAYWLGSGIWHNTLTLSGQGSSTHLMDIISDVENPVTLYAGKKYLVTPSCNGTAEYTTARSYDGTSRWTLEMVLTDEAYNTSHGSCLKIGRAQFYFNGNKGSDSAGYHFNVGISPVTTVIQPTSTLVLKKIVLMNIGNVLGTDSNNTAKLFMDYDLGHLVVQEMT